MTGAALAMFRKHYKDEAIAKEDIFWYCYGLLNSHEYQSTYEADLKKGLPRIPLAGTFWDFATAGRDLGHLHIAYDTLEPWPAREERAPQGDLDDYSYFRVEKMACASLGGRQRDKSHAWA